MRTTRYAILILILALLVLGLVHAQTSRNPTTPSPEAAFDSGGFDEIGVTGAAWKSHEQAIEWVKAVATPVGTVATLLIALFTLRAGNRNQFRLKALEVALNSSSSPQMKSKIKALQEFFPDMLKGFGKQKDGHGKEQDVDVSQFPLFSTYGRMLELLKLLSDSADNQHRTLIIESYAHMFPADLTDSTQWLQALAAKFGATLPAVGRVAHFDASPPHHLKQNKRGAAQRMDVRSDISAGFSNVSLGESNVSYGDSDSGWGGSNA